MLRACERLATAGQHKLQISRYSAAAPRSVRPILWWQVVTIHSAAYLRIMIRQPLARQHARADRRASNSCGNFARWLQCAARQLSVKRISASSQLTTAAEKLTRRKMRGKIPHRQPPSA
jgi:hypothetical protein